MCNINIIHINSYLENDTKINCYRFDESRELCFDNTRRIEILLYIVI